MVSTDNAIADKLWIQFASYEEQIAAIAGRPRYHDIENHQIVFNGSRCRQHLCKMSLGLEFCFRLYIFRRLKMIFSVQAHFHYPPRREKNSSRIGHPQCLLRGIKLPYPRPSQVLLLLHPHSNQSAVRFLAP